MRYSVKVKEYYFDAQLRILDMPSAFPRREMRPFGSRPFGGYLWILNNRSSGIPRTIYQG